MMPTTASVLPAIPPEVSDFAAANGATDYLDEILAMTRAMFPSAEISLALEDDPEIPFRSYVFVEVHSTFQPPEQIDGTYERWIREALRIWPDERGGLFTLSLRPVPL